MTEESKPDQTIVRRWEWLLAPLLTAIYPVLSLYATSVEEANPSDAAICGAVVVAVAIGLAYGFRLIFSTAIRASLATVIVVCWSFTYSAYMRVGRYALELVSLSPLINYVLQITWLILLIIVLSFLFRLRVSELRIGQLYRFLCLACVFAIGLALFNGVSEYLHAGQAGESTASVLESKQEAVPSGWKPQPPQNRRDIYYLVFDRYGNGNVLQKFFGFDNSEFYNALESRGFIVDRTATTSYPMTAPEMASVLNMCYLKPEIGRISDFFPPVQNNEVGKLFVEAGYKFHYFGNYYTPLRKMDAAQWNLKISRLSCEFADSIVNMTPLRPLIGRNYKYRFVTEKFAKVAELPNNPAATFAYAHFLVPHPPYVFARNGSPLAELDRAMRTEQQQYVDQLVATNKMILTLLDQILSSSRIKPIIILQADEGPYLMAGDESLSRDEQIAKRTGILTAVLIPDDEVRQKLPTPLKPVNTFRFLFKEYFAAPLELLPDRTFYWEQPTATGVATPGTRIVDVSAPPT